MEPTETPQPPHAFEEVPLTRSEYITSLVHFYRGEMARANTWRTRLDTTTNWAVVTTGGMLSFAFSQPEQSAVTLLLGNVLVAIFLEIEARRFRYFDVWRSRIRMIEENFFLPIIRRELASPRTDWRHFVSEDLDHPTFKVTLVEAIGMRLRRNYLGIFAVILIAWVAKLNLHPQPARDLSEIVERLSVGLVPGWAIALAAGLFYAGLLYLATRRPARRVSSDEVVGVEKDIDHWKT